MDSRPGGPYQPRGAGSDRPTKSQLLPFLGKGKEVVRKAYLVPYAVLFLLGFLSDHPFLWFMALGLAIATYYIVYRLCGKTKPLWLPLVPAAITALVVFLGLGIFTQIFSIPLIGSLPGDPSQWSGIPYPTLLYNIFFAVGLKEELMKAVAVLLCAFLAPKITSSFARDLEIHEPLDGILIATGSALGFTMVETMLQYVPEVLHQSGFSAGLDLLLIRVGGSLSGHIAYSGYWGYFIGLAMLKPRGRWKTIGIGWLFAAVLHSLWDSLNSAIPMLAVGIISYALLGAAILKARQISPTRSQNFATQLYRGPEQAVAQPYYAGVPAPFQQPPQAPPFNPGFPVAAPPQNFPPAPAAPAWNPAGAYAPPAPGLPPPAAPVSQGLTFFIAGQRIPLTPGRRFGEAELPGLRAAAGDGIVAEVTRHPTDSTIIGLRNTSTASWMAWTPNGESREIPSGKTIRLSPGTTVQFGSIRGEILA